MAQGYLGTQQPEPAEERRLSQYGAETQHGRQFAAFDPGPHLVGLGLRQDAVSVGMVPASALMWRGRSEWLRLLRCWAVGLAPWA